MFRTSMFPTLPLHTENLTDRAFLPPHLVQECKARRLKVCTNALVTRVEFNSFASDVRATCVHLAPPDSAAGAQG